MESETLAIPKIDFTGLVPGCTAGWDTVQAEVMQALESFGCFEVLYNKVTPELREALFSRAIPELLQLPTDVKKRNKYPGLPYNGYISRPEFGYESLRVDGNDAEGFTRLMWPQGNPSFCNTISAYSKNLKDLEQMIVRMIFRSLGMENYFESYTDTTEYRLRFAEIRARLDQENKVAMNPHFDPNLITIICQHKVEGLEVQTKDGEWIHVVPLPNSYTVQVGEAFEAWSNGRLQASLHRVRTIGNQKRNSALFVSFPKEGHVIKAPKELVDEEHPLLYKPYTFEDYLKFHFEYGGTGVQKILKEFCGVSGDEVQA